MWENVSGQSAEKLVTCSIKPLILMLLQITNCVQSPQGSSISSVKYHRTRKMHNGIMDVFFKKVNQRVNLGRHPMPDARPLGYTYFKGWIFEKPVQKAHKNNIVKTKAEGSVAIRSQRKTKHNNNKTKTTTIGTNLLEQTEE